MGAISALHAILQDTPIAYNPSLARAFGSVKATIFWLAIARWHGKGRLEKWVYKSARELEEETGLSPRAQEFARKKLCDAGLLTEERAGRNGVLHFRVNLERAIEIYSDWIRRNVETGFDETSKPDSTKRRNPLLQESNDKNLTTRSVARTSKDEEDEAKLEELRAIYNESAARAGWAKCFKIVGARRKYLLARLKETQDLEIWRKAFTLCERSAFLSGRVPDRDGRAFVATIDVFSRAGQLDMIINEGKFQDVAPSRGPRVGENEPEESDSVLRVKFVEVLDKYLAQMQLPAHVLDAFTSDLDSMRGELRHVREACEELKALAFSSISPAELHERLASLHEEFSEHIVPLARPGVGLGAIQPQARRIAACEYLQITPPWRL